MISLIAGIVGDAGREDQLRAYIKVRSRKLILAEALSQLYTMIASAIRWRINLKCLMIFKDEAKQCDSLVSIH